MIPSSAVYCGEESKKSIPLISCAIVFSEQAVNISTKSFFMF